MTKTALLFAGQGAQYVKMGHDLASTHATARDLFARADALLGMDLSRICFEGPEDELTQTEHAQPGIYITSWVALAMLKESIPDFDFHATAGLSLGEFTALAAANAVSFEDGLRTVRLRGRFMQQACDITAGGMAAIIGLEESITQEVCAEAGVTLANYNCPGQLVISGPKDRIPKALELAAARGARKAIPLTVAGAYHSPLMESASKPLENELRQISIHAPRVPVISNVTAQPHEDSPDSIIGRLVEQVTSPVRWEASIRYLLANGFQRFIELGPGTTLAGFLKRIDKSATCLSISDTPTLEKAVASLQ